jgi:hypothetical protein
MARKVDVSMMEALNAGASTQEVKKGGFSRTSDPNFPVFQTPVNKDILVYIPMTNVVQTENGPQMNLLTVHTHTYREGQFTSMLRCISGLEGVVFAQLGYDGTCPACEGVKDCWSLYNRKMEADARSMGVDPQNDPGDVLKSVRRKHLDEMAIKGTEEYVTFPIVVIPTVEGKLQPTNDALANLQPQFVVWTKKRYEKNILGALDSMFNNPGHPGGLFWIWKFSYDTGGKQANARDSAKNAKYMPITDGNFLKALDPAKPALEQAAAGFTNAKASEVVISNQYMYKEDLDEKVNKIMANTRNLLNLSEVESVGSGAPQLNAGAANNPLSGFGQLPDFSAGFNMGVENQAPKFGE